MKTVLLTGATGFLGRSCWQPLLDRGFQIHAVCHRQPTIDVPGIAWKSIDLLDHAAVSAYLREIRPTHLLHLAWITTPGDYWSSPVNLDWVAASLHLARAFADAGGKRIVTAGTCAEYDWSRGICSEVDTPLAPSTLYGVCKNGTRMIMEAFAKTSPITFVWGRLFFLYGPYEHGSRLVASSIDRLLAGQITACTSGTQARDFLHVRDAADAFVTLLDSEISGTFNVASGITTTIRNLVETIGRRIGRSDLVTFGNIPMRPDEPPILVADVQRIQQQTTWKPRFDLETGIDDAIRWRRNTLPEQLRAK